MGDDYKSKIKKSLMSHGFPLEMRVHRVLALKGWMTIAEAAYSDPEENKERRVDFVAHRTLGTNNKFMPNARINLIIECKRSKNVSWVFYSEEKEQVQSQDWDRLLDYGSFSLLSAPEELRPRFASSAIRKILAQSHQLPHKHSKLAISGHSFHPDGPDKHDTLYQAVSQVTKALESEFQNEIEFLDEDTKRFLRRFRLKKRAHNWTFWRYYPVVVYEGRMFEAIPRGDDIELEDVHYVQLRWETRKSFQIIDVVRADYFDSFLGLVDNELEELKRGVASLV